MDDFLIFIVEDDPFYGNLLQYHISLNPDYNVSLFSTAKECLDQLHLKPDVVCVDFGLPDMTGDQLLEQIIERNNALPVVMISGQEDITVAVSLLKKGATDYIVKNENTKDLLWQSILKIRTNSGLKKEVETLKEELGVKYRFDNLIGNSPGMLKTFQLMEKAISSNINIRITGETGTGKEVVAKSIHYNSDRKNKNFIAVNLAAIPAELVESELFGHEKGSFTGAHNQKMGKFELAHKGTLFLDEIGEMDLSIQSKILRALQEREFTRVGGNTTIKFDVRLITATHRDLTEEVHQGNFREDLYYRLMGLPIELPPLKSRGEDIVLIAEYLLEQNALEYKSKRCGLDRSAKKKMMGYSWPGNVRELKAVVDLACVMCHDNTILAEDLSFSILNGRAPISSEGKTMKEFTEELIFDALKKNNGNVLEAARILDIGKSTIYNLLNQTKE